MAAREPMTPAREPGMMIVDVQGIPIEVTSPGTDLVRDWLERLEQSSAR